ncbi:nitrite reductase small subunit NirD [Streptomyces sp. NPDC050264]|uniref:nitrite reductase small subunit NirD n=1 Tax=Streptomyces sp. NPDC050264 TaxID=3155038 RepID=UPI0034469F91
MTTTTMTTTAMAKAAPEKTALLVQLRLEDAWLTVCDLSLLTPGRGVAALLPDGRQAAVFLDRSGRVYAVDNTDPFTGAAVLSRGLLGSALGRPFVASPLLKQRFDLETGRCLDDEAIAVHAYPVRTA